MLPQRLHPLAETSWYHSKLYKTKQLFQPPQSAMTSGHSAQRCLGWHNPHGITVSGALLKVKWPNPYVGLSNTIPHSTEWLRGSIVVGKNNTHFSPEVQLCTSSLKASKPWLTQTCCCSLWLLQFYVHTVKLLSALKSSCVSVKCLCACL